MAAEILFNLLPAFLGTYVLAFLLKGLAVRLAIVDTPDETKIHKVPVPLLGGLAVLLGLCVGLCFNFELAGKFTALLIGGMFILLINLVDDIRKLSARLRFMIEVLVALGVILAGARISFLPRGLLGDLGEILITVIWFVGLANAFNYLDGMDGLATGSAAINAGFFAVILYWTKQPALATLSIILAGAALGFLPHNLSKSKMFLGDAGSTFLGFMLAGIGVLGDWAEDNVVRVAVPILILGVPIFDMVFTTVMRVREGKIKTIVEWLKYGGKDHFHHYLTDLGFVPIGAVSFIWVITAAFGLSAVMVSNDRAWEGVLTVLQASIIFGIVGVLMVVGKRRRRRSAGGQ